MSIVFGKAVYFPQLKQTETLKQEKKTSNAKIFLRHMLDYLLWLREKLIYRDLEYRTLSFTCPRH